MNQTYDFVSEICREDGISLASFSNNFCLRLEKDGVVMHVLGTYWGINNAASDRIACDKSACFSILQSSNVPAIAHKLIYNPQHRSGMAGPEGAWAHIMRLFESYKQRVVLKPNRGTKGQNVYYCNTVNTLEAAVQEIFSLHPDAAISPFQEIATEYRVFYVGGKCLFCYGKTRGSTWQHNLNQGGIASEIPSKTEDDKKRLSKLKSLATRAAKSIGINFATIDIAESYFKELAIMEINSGIMATQLLEQLPHLRGKIKLVYRTAIRQMLGIK